MYTTDTNITTPTDCRSIDIILCGAGGAAGPKKTIYFGSSGSGGNIISANGLPMSGGEYLDLSFSSISGTGATTLRRNGVILASAYNGNAGVNINNTYSPGASYNSTVGIGDTSFGSFYNAFGSNGADSINGTQPVMTGTGFGCPKGSGTWTDGGSGMGQRDPDSQQGPGYCLITYHIGKL
jgi:hypothetical protein